MKNVLIFSLFALFIFTVSVNSAYACGLMKTTDEVAVTEAAN